ncbi:cuticle protein AM1199-like [Planococcus citri]|uniref:cuticle protein AM1199-like n=1 Tax=Planococcus citri TaxID=170843 RepID=UPI0031F78690
MASRLAFLFLALFAVTGYVSAYPRIVRAAANQPAKAAVNVESVSVSSRDAGAQIIQYSNQFNPEDNSFVFQYETDNGIKAQGFAKDNEVSVQGSYFLVMPDGSQVPVHYIADSENGFQVDSPAIPTPHPVIAKVAEYLRTLPPQKEDVEEKQNASADI